MEGQEKVILVVGSCGLDRLLTVSKYPEADAKVRSTASHEVGGGNAANTASAMALLSSASIFRQERFCIKLVTKVGADNIGQQLKEELKQSGVDTTYVLKGEKGSTSSFTTVIVSEQEQTRTCIHTPGTCGNVTSGDIHNLDEIFANVVHVHSDSRLAEASLLLAQEAHKRNIPVSVDAEKDRKVEAIDQLLAMCDVLFTNTAQLKDHLERWTSNLEAKYDRLPLSIPRYPHAGNDDNTGIRRACALGIAPSNFFRRWFNEDPIRKKQVVITKGHKGALHVCCDSSTYRPIEDDDDLHEVIVAEDSSDGNVVNVQQRVVECNSDRTRGWTEDNKYTVHHTGVMSDVDVADTTGAGDAFIGAFILTQLMSKSPKDFIQFGLEFGAWVGGKKLGGPGARSALPSGADVDNELGRTKEEVQGRLRTIIKPFGVP